MKMKLLKYRKQIVAGILAIGMPVVYFYLLEFYTQNPFEKVRPWAQLFNIVLFELIAWILIFLTGKIRRALRIEAVLTMCFGIANAYVVRFRTNPIVPWDIFSLKTAASVADNYDYIPDKRMVIVTLIFVAIIIALHFLKTEKKTVIFWKRGLFAVVPLFLFILFVNTLQQENFQNNHRLYNKLFTPVYMTEVDGIAVTFAMNMAYMTIEKPAEYNVEETQKILANYETEVTKEATENLPNIIVVMNEAFSDLSVLGDFEANMDYMPYLHSLQAGVDNTVTGMLNVSVCGGNTANTEFEFLTGNTMAFLPQGSIPYQQYIKGEIPSLAEWLRQLGYETLATHPYYASGWDRESVYPWLGFSKMAFLDEYYDAEYVRKYVSDKSSIDKIIELYEEKESENPFFAFAVTMQNHSGYDEVFSDFLPDIKVNGLDNISLEQYLSLIKKSDESLQQLISYFEKTQEKTVIVFFGDHQPNDVVAAPILAMNGMVWNSLDEEELKLRYQVPYVIWANYDIESKQNADTSVNYLAAEVLERAGVPTSAYQNFLLALKEKYPVISTVRTVTANGSESIVSQEAQGMEEYQKLQYYQLFDRGGKE